MEAPIAEDHSPQRVSHMFREHPKEPSGGLVAHRGPGTWRVGDGRWYVVGGLLVSSMDEGTAWGTAYFSWMRCLDSC